MRNKLIVLTGPTAVGKTELSLRIAETLGCEIISADSRQIYQEMSIGTAAPTEEELKRAPHHLVRSRSVTEPTNAFDYEQMVMELLPTAFANGKGTAILTGGSMMYIDAVCKGIDEMPTISDAIRTQVKESLEQRGLVHMQEWLRELDPQYYATVDLQNPRRILHAIEICLESGKTCTELRQGAHKTRDFEIIKIAISRERTELYERIEKRVDQMMISGLVDEVRSLAPYRHLTPLNTVGYREIFEHLDGKYDEAEAVRLIKRNTRHYAKKQLTWLKADGEFQWIAPNEFERAMQIAKN